MEKSVLVSAIITTHNRSDLLEKAIASVSKQTYKPIELIVVDDASDETHSCEAIKLCSQNNAKYHYINKQDSKGGNFARNEGIRLSRGSLLAFLDDDDTWEETKIEKQVLYYQSPKHNAQVIVCGRQRIFVQDGQIKQIIRDIPPENKDIDFSTRIFCGPPFVTSELMISRDVIEKTGGFDEKLKAWQEYDLLIGLSAMTPFGCIDEALVNYYIFIDRKDRVSNKIDSFLISKDLVIGKYKDRISCLSQETKQKWDKLIWEECANRCGKCLDKRKYRKEIFKVEPSIKNFIYYVFNIDRTSNQVIAFINSLRKKMRS